jgi:hypothetical protein
MSNSAYYRRSIFRFQIDKVTTNLQNTETLGDLSLCQRSNSDLVVGTRLIAYSQRSAITGSTCAARNAGIAQAIPETKTRINVPSNSIAGSVELPCAQKAVLVQTPKVVVVDGDNGKRGALTK